MVFPTKRSIKTRIEALKEQREQKQAEEESTEETSIEVLTPHMFSLGPGSSLTDKLVSQGFVVERDGEPGDPSVSLNTTPPAFTVHCEIKWSAEGPTAARGDVRIAWDDDQLEEVLAQADQSTIYEPPDLPSEPVVVADGEGWEAVAPADRVVEEPIYRRSEANRHGYEILGSVPPWLESSDFELVVVDPASVPDDERRSSQ